MTIDHPASGHVPWLKALWQEAFGDSEAFIDLFFAHGFAPDRCRVAGEGDRLLGALYWFECFYGNARLAYVYAVGVMKDARGRGVGRRLMEDTHRHLRELGFDGCVLCPADEGLFGYYSRMGYTACAWVDEFTCTAGDAIALELLTAGEFAARRRALLPDGGVVQSGAALDYLAAYTGLYSGDGFLLAAYRDGEKLVGAELLGDRAAAPGIVAALGCREGVFHTPGKAKPFAMFHPLREGICAPSYLGLALD